MTRLFALLLTLLVSFPALADEAAIRQVMAAKLGLAVEGVQATPMAGVYEVQLRTSSGVHIVYTDAGAEHVILNGKMIDVKTERNLTEERLRKLNAIRFDSLPLDLAIKIRRGDGKRVLAMFADPYCPACKRFEHELAQVNDVTVYVFMIPIIHPELADDSRAIWCSQDRAKAWTDLSLEGRRPSAKPGCSTPLKQIGALADKLGVRATPTLFLADGERIDGGLSAEQLDAALNSAGRSAKRK
ncbi:MAG: DsbC family protein [Betaproteobacteria bacterium]|nr:DsbC family protein [Betaproteobacteria bacterium]